MGSISTAYYRAALGVAIMGSISTAYYRTALGETLPDGLSAEAARNAMATIGGAVTSAAKLNGVMRTDLIENARDAFTGSLALVAQVCAVLVMATGIIVLIVLRNPVAKRG